MSALSLSNRQRKRKREIELDNIFFSATLLSFSGKTVKKRKLFSDYLGLVVSLEPDNYPDIRSLMERCQALVGTRSVHNIFHLIQDIFGMNND